MKLSFVAAAALLCATPAFATAPAFLVDFEKIWDYANGAVDGYYSGGTAADGSAGSNQGVAFVGVSGLSNDSAFTYYSNAPSPKGVAYAFNTRAFMNVAAGVDSTLYFSYATPIGVAGAIKAYSGTNGSGALLGSIDLAANSGAGYDSWNGGSFSFSGTARSFDLGAGANVVALDNVSSVPESSTLLLMALGGVGVLGLGGRRRG